MAARASEDELIARHLAPLAGPGGLGLRDDAALLTPRPGHDLVLTVDAIVEGVHFLPDDPPETLAAKALGVNLSDLAAKGAAPVGYLLVLALPDGWTETWLADFCAGLRTVAEETGCPLLGGDTVRAAGPLSISVTALGEVPAGTMVRRTTARPGDLVCVTGTIGDAALGLALLTAPASPRPDGEKSSRTSVRPDEGHGKPAAAGYPPLTRSAAADSTSRRQRGEGDAEGVAFLIDRYRRPRPRLALAPALRAYASAAMDVSDGLAGDLAKMLRASGVSGTLDLDRIPLSPAASARHDGMLNRIAGGGDDYEILFTLPPDRLDAMTREAAAIGLPVTVVGEVRAGEAPLAIRLNGEPYALAAPSFQHFGM